MSKSFNFSDPKDTSLFWVTNLNVKLAVFPNNDLILSGLSKPGNSTEILLEPLLVILGSFVPTSSTLFLTISIAWSNNDCSISMTPYLVRVNSKIPLIISTLYWLDL